MIQITGLNKKFNLRGIAGIHSLELSLGPGQIMALVGPNGSGKTTLLNLIADKIKPDSGTIQVDGAIKIYPSHTPEDNQIVQKFLENQVSVTKEQDKKVQLARDSADLFEFTSVLKQTLSELSAGQRQKVLLAGELINRPGILLLDEPFTHLDPFTRKDILKSLFKAVKEQRSTLLWVTHELSEALRFSDIIGVLNFGRLQQLSSPPELMKYPKNLFIAQFIGYKNFFPVKKISDTWQTPWGSWLNTFETSLEGFMVIPDKSWRLSATSAFKCVVLQAFTAFQSILIEVKNNEKVYSIELPVCSKIPDPGTILGFEPIWEESFIIPL